MGLPSSALQGRNNLAQGATLCTSQCCTSPVRAAYNVCYEEFITPLNAFPQQQIALKTLKLSLVADPLLGGDVWASAQTGVGALRKHFETTTTTAGSEAQRQRPMALRPVDPPPVTPVGRNSPPMEGIVLLSALQPLFFEHISILKFR